jgi:hypothetical protein
MIVNRAVACRPFTLCIVPSNCDEKVERLSHYMSTGYPTPSWAEARGGMWEELLMSFADANSVVAT